jgi:Na+/melibiose symporter-like transporter
MAAAFLCGIPVWAILSRRIDKKPTILTGIAGFSTFILAPPLLALAGLWPALGSAESGRLVLLLSALAAFFGAAGFVAAGSMMADIADEHELSSRRRQEGIFFGTLNLAGKSSSGIGHVIAGVLMDAIHFPRQVGVDQVPADLARSLAVFFSIFLVLLGGFSLFFVSRYRLDRSRHAEIRRALLARANAPVAPGTERAPAEAAPSAAPSGYR